MARVIELFGRDTSDKSHDWQEIVTSQVCPFNNKRCFKVRKSQSDVSIGTCTITYGQEAEKPIMICPTRLTDRGRIFLDCIHLLTLHEPGNELHLIPEIKIPGGNVDYFLASAKQGKIVDFVGIELQTLDTTGSVWPDRQRLLRELGVDRADNAENDSKPVGMNWKMTAKTILVQMHHKAATFEHVNRKLVLVIQDDFLAYMKREFKFQHFNSPPSISDTVQIHPYSIDEPDHGLRGLSIGTRLSTDAEGIGEALGVQTETRIELKTIISTLEGKMSPSTRFEPFKIQ